VRRKFARAIDAQRSVVRNAGDHDADFVQVRREDAGRSRKVLYREPANDVAGPVRLMGIAHALEMRAHHRGGLFLPPGRAGHGEQLRQQGEEFLFGFGHGCGGTD
jgi:hypothetical protein